jgi:hypothetical protein
VLPLSGKHSKKHWLSHTNREQAPSHNRPHFNFSDQRPLITISAGVSPTACQFGRYIDSTCGGGTR